MPRTPVLAYLSLALSMSLVGSYVALSGPLAATFPVFLLAWLRFGIGAVAMAHWLRKPADEAPLTPRLRALLFLESFLGNFLFTLCMIGGVSLSGAVAAGVVMAAIPALVALLSWAFLGERIGARVKLAIGCAAMGIALLALNRDGAAAAHPAAAAIWADAATAAWLGPLLLLAAAVCEAAYSVIGKALAGALGPRRISALINLWGFALATPLGVSAALRFDFAAVPPGMWLLLLFYSLAACMWTVWLWMTGLKTVPASRAGVFTVFLPVSATLVGVGVLGEALQAAQAIALGLALAGVLLATLPGRRAGAA